MAQYQLAATIRDQIGKQAVKKMRKELNIPGVFYGPGSETVMISFKDGDLRKILKNAASEHIVMGLQIQTGKGIETKNVILKELQSDPLKDSYIHADFHEISMDKELTLDVSVVLVNTPVGVSNGGILQHVRRELTISCLPDKLVDFIEIDVSGLEIGDSLHIKDVVFPEGITSPQEGHLTVAVVNAPTVSEAAPAEEGAEDEKEEAAKE
ncbi:MAG: 50S ribosomal protein L25 [Deltaproteobacteria bacterium]|nr:50S ribosomal protein L25 [Deltaproteobacteria bacterium]